MQSRNLLTLVLLISSVFLSSCIIPSSLQKAYKFEKSKIFLEVENGKLVISGKDGKKCKKNEEYDTNNDRPTGCIRAPKYSVALIEFQLQKSKGWYFTKMEICLGEEKPTTTSPCALEKTDIGQFSAGASKKLPRYNPDSDGVIDLTEFSNISKFNLLDLNSFSGDYFYIIEACKGDLCVTLDPPIENEGGGGHGWG